MSNRQRPCSRSEFDIAIICSLPQEFDALSLVTDECWDQIGDRYGRSLGDINHYTTARIGTCNVVIVLPSRLGKANSAHATANLRLSYPNIKLALLVGTCGGVPSVGGERMRPGDVVLSRTMVEYGSGRQSPRGSVTQRDTVEHNLSPPDRDIVKLLAPFKSPSEFSQLRSRAATILGLLQSTAAERNKGAIYDKPDVKPTDAYDSPYRPNASRTRIDKKPKYQHANNTQTSTFAMYTGPITSVDMVVESDEHRNRLIQDEGVIAFEMPGAGVWKGLPTITVKGVCDSPNTEKGQGWQEYAAATAAAASRAIIEGYTHTENPKMAPAAVTETLTATQHGSTYDSTIRARNADLGESLRVSSTFHRHYVQERSHFAGDIQCDEDVAQGNKMHFT